MVTGYTIYFFEYYTHINNIHYKVRNAEDVWHLWKHASYDFNACTFYQ